PRNNRIDVTVVANFSTINTGLPQPTPSLQAPPFRTSVTADFNKQETDNRDCPGEGSTCFNDLETTVNVTLLPNHSVRLPGSRGALASNVTVENGGAAIGAQELAKLHPPRRTPVMAVSLEPSQGNTDGNPLTPEFIVRGVGNSQTAWVTARWAGVSLTS